MSERKKIISYVQDPIKVTCYYDREWNEYQVRVYVDDGNKWQYQGDKNTYYTDDKEDALDTMNDMLHKWHQKANLNFWETVSIEIPDLNNPDKAITTSAPIDRGIALAAFERI